MPKSAKAAKNAGKGGKAEKTRVEQVEDPPVVMYSPEGQQQDIEPKPEENQPLAQPMAMISIFTLMGDYKTILQLLKCAFQFVDRVCLDTPWGTYVIFEMKMSHQNVYCVFDGCVCNPMRFRYLNLKGDKSDLVYFKSMHEMLKWLIMAQRNHGHCSFPSRINADEICYNENMKNIFL